MGLVAPQHVESSRTRAQARVPCIGRWILSHCATREAHSRSFNSIFKCLFILCKILSASPWAEFITTSLRPQKGFRHLSYGWQTVWDWRSPSCGTGGCMGSQRSSGQRQLPVCLAFWSHNFYVYSVLIYSFFHIAKIRILMKYRKKMRKPWFLKGFFFSFLTFFLK